MLWVYEGQTEFWGRVLAARASLRTTVRTTERPINYPEAPKYLPIHDARSAYPPCVPTPTSQSHPYAQTKRRCGSSRMSRSDRVHESDWMAIDPVVHAYEHQPAAARAFFI